MNKFAILLCFLIVFTQQATVEEIYDDAIYFFKGMSSTTEYKCYNTMVTQKTKLITIINKIVDEVKGGKSIINAIKAHSLEILFINKLSENCNFSTIMSKALEIYSEKGIKDIGYNIINNNGDIYTDIKGIADNSDIKVKAEYAGKLVKILTGLNVY